MTDEQGREAALNRYWNAIFHADDAMPDPDLAPEEIEVVRRLHHAATAPLPGLAAEAAWPRVLARIEGDRAPGAESQVQVSSNHHRVAAGSPHPLPPLPARWERGEHPSGHGWDTAGQRGLVYFAAALVLLALATSLAMVGWFRGERGGDAAVMPALLLSPAASPPAGRAEIETILATVLPAEMVPGGGNLDYLIFAGVIEPGRELAGEDPVDCCPGPQIIHVVEGDLALTVAGPLQIARASAIGAAPAEPSPDGVVTLHAGDSALFDHAALVSYGNRGAVPVRFISGGLFAGMYAAPWEKIGAGDFNEIYPVPALPPGPVRVTLVRATLPPKGTVPAPAPGALVVDVGAYRDEDIGKRADATLVNLGPRTATFYALTFAPLGDGTGTPAS